MRRKRKQKNNSMDDSWLLPYADMLTLVLALFIVLYASSEVDQQKFESLRDIFFHELSSSSGAPGILDGEEGIGETPTDGDLVDSEDEEDEVSEPNEEEDLEEHFSDVQYREFLQIQREINSYIADQGLDDQVNTELTDEGLMLTIVNDVLFDSGSAELKDESHETAREISEILHTEPPHQIVISGHADDVPIGNELYESNWELSVARALNFMKLILQNESLDPTLFSAKGFGEYEPLFPNDSAENRARNRRVEVLILPNIDIVTEEEETGE